MCVAHSNVSARYWRQESETGERERMGELEMGRSSAERANEINSEISDTWPHYCAPVIKRQYGNCPAALAFSLPQPVSWRPKGQRQ